MALGHLKQVDLGLVEECDSSLLTNRYFPSKVGGKPAWLELKNLPKVEDISCPRCKEPMAFLCQVYAPIEDREDCFHRTIFVFICRKEDCNQLDCAQNITVYRSQLKRVNDYYSADAPSEDEKLPAVLPLEKLCAVCGCRGPYACSQCKIVNYCGPVHQKLDWKSHKLACRGTNKPSSTQNEILFPEFEIVIEPETDYLTEAEEEGSEAEERRMEEYEDLVKSGNIGCLKDIPDADLLQYTPEGVEDKQFCKFKKRVNTCPEQILRYERGGNPLWIANKNTDEDEIPICEKCGNSRIFEFQIMPQLLHYIKDYKLDWGTIAIYTCSESCESNSSYCKEFAIKQDVKSNKNS